MLNVSNLALNPIAVLINTFESPFAMITYPIDQETALNSIPNIPQLTKPTMGENSLEYNIVIIKGANVRKMTMIGEISKTAIRACSKTAFLIFIISLAIADKRGK